MPDEIAPGASADEAGKTLADKVDWLFQTVHPADRGPYSLAEAAAKIEEVTGEKVSHTALWKLRTGRNANPTKRLIEAVAQVFGVPPAFFFDDKQSGVLQDQIELLTLLRDSGVDKAQLRAFAALTPDGRQAITDLIAATARAEEHRTSRQPDRRQT